MEASLEGGCTCGAVRYRLSATPMFVNCCHCTWCQRETGSGFVINVIIETACLKLTRGESESVLTATESGEGQVIHRCPNCHVALWSHYGELTALAYVRAGTLDEAAAVAPGAFLFTRSKLPWIGLPAAIPSFKTHYDRDTLWPAESLARRTAALGV
jgi:hypothetical protein